MEAIDQLQSILQANSLPYRIKQAKPVPSKSKGLDTFYSLKLVYRGVDGEEQALTTYGILSRLASRNYLVILNQVISSTGIETLPHPEGNELSDEGSSDADESELESEAEATPPDTTPAIEPVEPVEAVETLEVSIDPTSVIGADEPVPSDTEGKTEPELVEVSTNSKRSRKSQYQ